MMLGEFLRNLRIIDFRIQERRSPVTACLVIDDCTTVMTRHIDDLVPYLGFTVTNWRLSEDAESCDDRAVILEIIASSMAASPPVQTASILQKSSRFDLIVAVVGSRKN